MVVRQSMHGQIWLEARNMELWVGLGWGIGEPPRLGEVTGEENSVVSR